MYEDLHRFGKNITLVTVGSGVFEVDKQLVGITETNNNGQWNWK